jgi:hypothetical protein
VFAAQPSRPGGWLGLWHGDVHDNYFHPLITRFEGLPRVFSDHGFHAKEGDPSNLKVCKPFDHNERMIGETVISTNIPVYLALSIY